MREVLAQHAGNPAYDPESQKTRNGVICSYTGQLEASLGNTSPCLTLKINKTPSALKASQSLVKKEKKKQNKGWGDGSEHLFFQKTWVQNMVAHNHL